MPTAPPQQSNWTLTSHAQNSTDAAEVDDRRSGDECHNTRCSRSCSPVADEQGQVGRGSGESGRAIVVRYRYGEPLPEPAAGEGAAAARCEAAVGHQGHPIRGETIFELYAIKANTRDGKAPLDGGVVTEAREGICAARIAAPKCRMTMNAAGARSWARLTADNIGRQRRDRARWLRLLGSAW